MGLVRDLVGREHGKGSCCTNAEAAVPKCVTDHAPVGHVSKASEVFAGKVGFDKHEEARAGFGDGDGVGIGGKLVVRFVASCR